MIDIASTALGVAIGSMLLHGWRILNAPDTAEAERRVSRLEEIVRKALKKTSAKPPLAGPYRTAPIGDPNTESSLPDPTPSVMRRIYAWDKNLACPMCRACNRWKKIGENKDGSDKDVVNTSTHTSCNGCDVEIAPHLHVECWACKFKYAVNPASESEKS